MPKLTELRGNFEASGVCDLGMNMGDHHKHRGFAYGRTERWLVIVSIGTHTGIRDAVIRPYKALR